jgi:lysophospholipase L1-like esterase
MSFLQYRFHQDGSSDFTSRMNAIHRLKLATLSGGRIVLLGDSMVQAAHCADIAGHCAEFGLGGALTLDVLRFVREAGHFQRPQAFVLWVGINDLLHGRTPPAIKATMAAILGELEGSVPVLVSGLAPVNAARLGARSGLNRAIWHVNEGFRVAAASRERCHYVPFPDGPDPGSASLHVLFDCGDGLHLSRAGYAAWTAGIRMALALACPASPVELHRAEPDALWA